MLAIKWTAAIVAAALVVFLLMPSDRLNGIKESWRRSTNDRGQLCLDFEKERLKDPDSAHLVKVSVLTDWSVSMTYKAKNGYGAYGQDEVICSFGVDGKIHPANTELAREIVRSERTIKLLEADSECIERRNALIARGVAIAEATRLAGGPCNTADRLR